jgi:hypothetical protein
MTVHIKLYGGKADRFQEVKASLTDQMGYEPSNPEVVGMLLGQYPADSIRSKPLNEQLQE